VMEKRQQASQDRLLERLKATLEWAQCFWKNFHNIGHPLCVHYLKKNKGRPYLAGRMAELVKRWTHRPKGTGFDPCLDHKRRSTWATNSFSMWDNKDLLIIASERISTASPSLSVFTIWKNKADHILLSLLDLDFYFCLHLN
jgi:hypothetical protein